MYNTMRISGLASGIDTEEIVQNMMKVERLKLDRVEQDRQVSIWRQEIYNNLNKDFANFILSSRKMFGLTSVTSKGTLVPNSYQNLNWVKKATSSNESIATVSSMGKAVDGTYKVNVKQLAEGVTAASREKIDGDKILENAYRVEDPVTGEMVYPEKISFTVNGEEVEVNRNSNGKITMSDVVKAINSTKDIGVRASYDADIGRFFIQTTGTGKEANIEIGAIGTEASFIEELKLDVSHCEYASEDDTIGIKKFVKFDVNTSYKGINAVIDFNGADNITSSSNHITINGITMDLKAEGDFTVTVDTDVDTAYEKIEQFINGYNELVDKTNKLLGEKQYRDYRPLSAEEKKAMDKADVDLWEEKAKSGLLRNDDIIQRTMQNMRTSLYKGLDDPTGAFKHITEIGIATEKYSRGSFGGKLEIDEQKLKEAIAKDPDSVMELLFKESVPEIKNEDGTTKQEGKNGGILSRIYDNLMVGMESIIKKSGTGDNADLYRGVKSNILLDFVTEYSSISLLDKDVLQFSKRIDDLNAQLYRKENAYYARFAAMEKAISKMNQQSAWLGQQFMS